MPKKRQQSPQARSIKATSAAVSRLNPVARAVGNPSHPAVTKGVEKLIDPARIRKSKTPSRMAAAFRLDDPDYAELHESIGKLRGNKIPVLVRSLTARERGKSLHMYELIAGERRVRACRDHGLKVFAKVVDKLDPGQQVLLTLTENAGRSSLRPYELGRQVMHAMKVRDKSQNAIAEELGRDNGLVSKAVAIANLPTPVIRAFSSPRDIRYRDLAKLQEALNNEPEAVLEVARQLRDSGAMLEADEVMQRLLRSSNAKQEKTGVEPFNTPVMPALFSGSRRIADISLDKTGRLEVRMKVSLSEQDQRRMLENIKEYVEQYVLAKPKQQGSLEQEATAMPHDIPV